MYYIDQKIAFYVGHRECSRRGGHVAAFAKVVKINKKTVVLEEITPSYSPGFKWVWNKEYLLENLVSRGMHTSEWNVNLNKVY